MERETGMNKAEQAHLALENRRLKTLFKSWVGALQQERQDFFRR